MTDLVAIAILVLVVVPNHNRHEDPGRHAAYLDDAFDDDEETPPRQEVA